MKILSFLIAALLLSFTCYAQSEVKMALVYMPNHTYKITGHSGLLMNMSIVGDAKVQARLKAQGVKQPITMSITNSSAIAVHTSSFDSAHVLPIKMVYDKLETNVTYNGQSSNQTNPLTGKALYGKYSNGKVHLDSVGGMKTSDTLAAIVTQMLNGIANAVKYPDHPLKVGDAFTQNVPLNIPVPGVQTATANINVTYKLVQISNGTAYFDIVTGVLYHFVTQGKTLNANGHGTGKMTYDLSTQFMSDYHMGLDLTMHALMDKNTKLNVVMHSNNSSNTIVVAAD